MNSRQRFSLLGDWDIENVGKISGHKSVLKLSKLPDDGQTAREAVKVKNIGS
jgi:hypothetical protein